MNTSSTIPTTGGGTNYGPLDFFKRRAQELARQTADAIKGAPIHPIEKCRGESAYTMQVTSPGYISHVNEGLGTKILLADWLFRHRGDASGYSVVAQDTIAMIVNDLVTLGSCPFSIQMHLAIGHTDYLANETRSNAILEGWLKGCLESEAVWTGGETPALVDVVNPDTAVMAGSADGWQPTHFPPVTPNIQADDVIILLASSGVHANGLSLIRRIADCHEHEKEELFRDCLVPTRNYVRAVKAIVEKGPYPHSLINITGHGWRKLMRAEENFTYVIDEIPPVHDVFRKIQNLGEISVEDMFGGYNMGAGFAIICRRCDADLIQGILTALGYENLLAGYVQKGPKQVVINPAGITFSGDSLDLRG